MIPYKTNEIKDKQGDVEKYIDGVETRDTNIIDAYLEFFENYPLPITDDSVEVIKLLRANLNKIHVTMDTGYYHEYVIINPDPRFSTLNILASSNDIELMKIADMKGKVEYLLNKYDYVPVFFPLFTDRINAAIIKGYEARYINLHDYDKYVDKMKLAELVTPFNKYVGDDLKILYNINEMSKESPLKRFITQCELLNISTKIV